MTSPPPQITTVPINSISPTHLEPFKKAFNRILSLDRAKSTLAQIIDGVPTGDDEMFCGWQEHQPREFPKPSSDAMQMAGGYLEGVEGGKVRVSEEIIKAYQETEIGSKQFNFRLLEILATAWHMVAATLFEHMNNKFPDYSMEQPKELKLPFESEETYQPKKPFPTRLLHSYYSDYSDYPLGVADVVGYWAEAQVFGGVVLFNRGENGTECSEAFLHPRLRYAIFQLSETQLEQFIDFALNDSYDTDTLPTVLPIRTEKYARRIQPWDLMEQNIFRNSYEWRYRRPQCVRRAEDYPEMMEFLEEHRKKEEEEKKNLPPPIIIHMKLSALDPPVEDDSESMLQPKL